MIPPTSLRILASSSSEHPSKIGVRATDGQRQSDLTPVDDCQEVDEPRQRDSVTTADLDTLYAHPLGCRWEANSPRTEETCTTAPPTPPCWLLILGACGNLTNGSVGLT